MQGHENSKREALDRIFNTASLDDVATRMIEIEVSYADFDAYWEGQTALANTTVQYLRKMSAPEVERVKAHLRERLPQDRSGRIAYKARASAAKGRVPG